MKQTQASVVREFTRIFKNEHNVDGIDHLFAPDFRHNFRMPLAPGLAGFKDIGRMMNAAFPDVRVTEEALIVSDDHVVERSSAVATHRGLFMGIAGTGKPVHWTEIHIYRLRDGLIGEHWVELSTLELIGQIRPADLASVHEIGIVAPCEVVFELLSTQAGLRKWWTDAVVAAPAPGHVNRFGFGGGSVEMPFRVDRHEAPRSIAWTCIEGDRVPPDWVGTRIVATAMPQADGTTRLRFAHEGWRPDATTFALCNTTWGELMHRLRDAAVGGHPGPHFKNEAPAVDGKHLVREL
jgi:predicted ester cyclase/uncharacterized protein YndB with AHSA1/START domain